MDVRELTLALEAPNPTTGSPLEIVRSKRDRIRNALRLFLDDAKSEQRQLKASEQRAAAKVAQELTEFDERVKELEDEERRENAARAARAEIGVPAQSGGGFYTSSETYHPGNNGPSFFKDLWAARNGDADAADRLRRNNAEQRAMGNPGGVLGSGGELSPPKWLISDWIKLARPGRVTADLFHHEVLENGYSTVNIPKASVGTITAVQSTQNTALASQDMVTTSLSSTITTVGGKVVISQQLLDTSGGEIDKILFADLVADYSKQMGFLTLYGSGSAGQLKGYVTAASSNIITWTQASPTAGGFLGQLSKLVSQIYTTRFMPVDAIVMHPRRWMWLASAVDSTGRPLVVPSAGGVNTIATVSATAEAGHVGQALGIDVYLDPNITITDTGGNNADQVLVFPRNDVWLWESTLRADVQTATYADSLGLLYRCWNYSAMIPDRYPAALGVIKGSGLATPAWPS